MAYDPDEHGRLESLYLKYGARLQSEARSAGLDVSEAYEDALATAHAIYAYLLAHPVEGHHDRRDRAAGARTRPSHRAGRLTDSLPIAPGGRTLGTRSIDGPETWARDDPRRHHEDPW